MLFCPGEPQRLTLWLNHHFVVEKAAGVWYNKVIGQDYREGR
jgi:hypothetical protein